MPTLKIAKISDGVLCISDLVGQRDVNSASRNKTYTTPNGLLLCFLGKSGLLPGTDLFFEISMNNMLSFLVVCTNIIGSFVP